jgi:drug/metabolite transporter (DMT)-like permease
MTTQGSAAARHSRSDWLVLAALVVAWGSAFAALKIAVHDFTPAWNTAVRLWVATATMLIITLARGERPPRFSLAKDSPWRAYAWIGAVGLAIPFVMFAFAATRLPSAVNAICNGASPLFTAALAQALLADERLGWRKLAGVGLGFVGLVVLVAPRLATGGSLEALALGSAIFGAFLYAVSNIITRKAPPVSALSGALMMCSVGAVLATIWAAVASPLPAVMPSAKAWAAVTALGVFSSALGSVGYVYLVQRRGPVFMSMAIYLAPLWATALGVAVLGERPGWPAYLALALILAGVGLTTTPGRKA